MKNLLLILLLVVISTNLVSSAPPVIATIQAGELTISTNLPEAIPKNITREWEIHVINQTGLITSGANCTLHIYEESGDGGHLYRNSTATSSNDDYEIIAPANVHLNKGLYSFKAYCKTANQAGLYEKSYYVTKSGHSPAEDQLTIFIYSLFIVCIVVLFYTFLTTLTHLATFSETVYTVILSWSAYILVIIVNYLGEEYLIRTYVENITSFLLTASAFTNVLLPLLSIIITMFVKSTMKKKPLSVQELAGRQLS